MQTFQRLRKFSSVHSKEASQPGFNPSSPVSLTFQWQIDQPFVLGILVPFIGGCDNSFLNSIIFFSICLFMSVWIHRFLFYSLSYNPLVLLFWCSNYPMFSQWEPLQAGSCVLFTCHHHSLSISLLSGIRGVPRSSCTSADQSPRISYFSRSPGFF